MWCGAGCIGFVTCADRIYIRTMDSATPVLARPGGRLTIAMCSPVADVREQPHFCLAFQADQSDESSCANRAQKKDTENQHDQRRNQHSRHRRGTGRARRAGEGLLEERGQPEEGRAQGPESRQGRKSQGRPRRREPRRARRPPSAKPPRPPRRAPTARARKSWR